MLHACTMITGYLTVHEHMQTIVRELLEREKKHEAVNTKKATFQKVVVIVSSPCERAHVSVASTSFSSYLVLSLTLLMT